MGRRGTLLTGLAAILALTLCLTWSAFAAGKEKIELPAAAQAILAKAGKLIADKEYAAAAQVIVQFQKSAPPEEQRKDGDKGWFHAEVCHALGVCYLFQERYEEAAKALKLAIDGNPRHQGAQLNLGKAYYELGHHDKAAACFLAAYENGEDKNPEHLYFAAVARLLAKQYGQAIPLFERLLAEHHGKTQPEWRENLVHALLAAGEIRRALPHLETLAETSQGKKQRQWQELLLHQYLQLNLTDKALAYAEGLSAKVPTEVLWWRALTHLHLQQNRYKEALTCLLVTGYLDQLSPEEQRLTADLYLQLGVPRQAVPLYKGMIAAGSNQQLLANLLVALQQLGRSEEALETLDKLAPTPLSSELALQKADLLFTLGRYQEAASLYRKIAASASGKQRDRALQMVEHARAQMGGNG